MAKSIRCSIFIDEVDGKLHIMANIPDNAEKCIAGALAQALIEQSASIMNTLLNENQTVEKLPQPS